MKHVTIIVNPFWDVKIQIFKLYLLCSLQELQNQGGMDKKINLSDLYIPTPEVFLVDASQHYKALYKGEYKVPRQYIHVQVVPNLVFSK